MNPWLWIPVVAVVLAIASALLAFPWWRRRQHEEGLAEARNLFRIRREWLEAKFVTMASGSGCPRGLEWVDCDFENGAALARDRGSGQLRAFVGVTIRFRAIEGSDMQGVEAVDNLRVATAVFLHDGEQWATDGRAIFNLNPSETIEHFQHELDVVE